MPGQATRAQELPAAHPGGICPSASSISSHSELNQVNKTSRSWLTKSFFFFLVQISPELLAVIVQKIEQDIY